MMQPKDEAEQSDPILIVQNVIHTFILAGAGTYTSSQLAALRNGFRNFQLKCKENELLAIHGKETLTVVRAILSVVGGSVDN